MFRTKTNKKQYQILIITINKNNIIKNIYNPGIARSHYDCVHSKSLLVLALLRTSDALIYDHVERPGSRTPHLFRVELDGTLSGIQPKIRPIAHAFGAPS